MNDVDAVLSVADVADEAALLGAHDVAALRDRLERSLRRRRRALWALPVALFAAATAGGLAVHSPPEPPPPPALTTTTTTATTTLLAPRPAPAPAIGAAAEVAPPRRVRSRPLATPTTTTTTTTAPEQPTPPTLTPTLTPTPAEEPPETSRLRAELQAIDEATRELKAGRAEQALAVLRRLRAEHEGSPVDVDAAVLIVRCLRFLGRDDEARAALAEVDAHPHAQQQRAARQRLHRGLDLDVVVDDEADDEGDDPVRR